MPGGGKVVPRRRTARRVGIPHGEKVAGIQQKNC